MPNFSLDEKLKAIHRYQNGTEGVKSIAKSIGISMGRLQMKLLSSSKFPLLESLENGAISLMKMERTP